MIGSLFILISLIVSVQVSADTVIEQADLFYQQGHINKSIKYYRYELRKQPDSLQAKMGLAKAYLAKNKLTAANNLFNDVLESDPTNFDAKIGIAQIHMRQSKWEVAQKILFELDTAYPDTLDVKHRLMNNYIQMGQLDLADQIHQEIKLLQQQ